MTMDTKQIKNLGFERGCGIVEADWNEYVHQFVVLDDMSGMEFIDSVLDAVSETEINTRPQLVLTPDEWRIYESGVVAGAKKACRRLMKAGRTAMEPSPSRHGAFESIHDLDMHLGDPSNGWIRDDGYSGLIAYKKNFSGVWYAIMYGMDTFPLDEVRLWPTRTPPGATFEEVKTRLSRSIAVQGSTIDGIEDIIRDLVEVHKETTGPRKRADRSGLSYGPRGARVESKGEEALNAWKADVRNVFRENMDGNPRFGWTTSLLMHDLLENRGGYVLHGATRAFMSRTARSILEDMAKRGEIEKDTNERAPKWFGTR